MAETFDQHLARLRDLAVGGGHLPFRHVNGHCELSPDTQEALAELLRRWDALPTPEDLTRALKEAHVAGLKSEDAPMSSIAHWGQAWRLAKLDGLTYGEDKYRVTVPNPHRPKPNRTEVARRLDGQAQALTPAHAHRSMREIPATW